MTKITLTFEGTIKEIKGQMTEVMQAMTDIKSDTPSFLSSEVKLGSVEYNHRIQEEGIRAKSMQSQSHTEEKTKGNPVDLRYLAGFNERVTAYKGDVNTFVKRFCLRNIAEAVAQMGTPINVDWFNVTGNEEIELFSQAWCARTEDHKSPHHFSELISKIVTVSADARRLTEGIQKENTEKETPGIKPLIINLPEECIAGKTEGCLFWKIEEGQAKYKFLVSDSLDEGETSLIFISDGPGEDGLFVWTKDLD
jgi:hypothetical protein